MFALDHNLYVISKLPWTMLNTHASFKKHPRYLSSSRIYLTFDKFQSWLWISFHVCPSGSVAIPQPMDLFWNISLRVLAYAILLATWLAQVQSSCTIFDKCSESPLVSRFQLLDCLLYFPTFPLRYVIRTSSSSGLSCIEKPSYSIQSICHSTRDWNLSFKHPWLIR